MANGRAVSRQERLWIVALERSACDVILDPFHAGELRRILEIVRFCAASGGSAGQAVPAPTPDLRKGRAHPARRVEVQIRRSKKRSRE